MAIFDSHAHLADESFGDDIDDIIMRAAENTVDRILVVADSLHTTRQAFALTSKYKGLYSTAGIHPHNAHTASQSDKNDLLTFVSENRNRISAIGETGLDLYYGKDTFSEQAELFDFHLKLAVEFNLPVVIHCRDAEKETLNILDAYPNVRGVFHCFTGDSNFCKKVIERGFFVSFSGIVTFKNSQTIREAAQCVPLDKILIETDSPYLAPQGFRGKRNEPALIVVTRDVLAEIKCLAPKQLSACTYENTMRLFNIRNK
ncbi:TatD family hydrolase [bacterium]|nr:TatD family hydrolase [bacterium]